MKQKHGVSLIFALIFIPGMITVAYANSSWHWVTKNPLTILPWAICITLMVETITLCTVNPIKRPLKVSIFVVVANLSSFLLPYLLIGLLPEIYYGRFKLF